MTELVPHATCVQDGLELDLNVPAVSFSVQRSRLTLLSYGGPLKLLVTQSSSEQEALHSSAMCEEA